MDISFLFLLCRELVNLRRMKRLFVFSVIIAGLLLSGCKKEEVTPDPRAGFVSQDYYMEFYDYLSAMKASVKTYQIYSFTGIYTDPDSNETVPIITNSEGDAAPDPFVINGQKIEFNDYQYSSSHNFSYADTMVELNGVFGNNYNLKFNNDELLFDSIVTINAPEKQLYIPKLFQPIEFDNLSKNDEIIDGTMVKWVSDEDNQEGVLIKLEYDPNVQNQSLVDVESYPDYINRGRIVEDNGSYTFRKSNFADFPYNADVHISFEKITYKKFKDEDENNCAFVTSMLVVSGFDISMGE